MKITHRYEISKDLNKYLMRKKIKLFAISSWFAPSEKKLNLFIQFLLNYKILNQNAIFLYYKHTQNLRTDEIDKIISFSFSFIIIFVCYIEICLAPSETFAIDSTILEYFSTRKLLVLDISVILSFLF